MTRWLDWLKFFPFAKAQYTRPVVNEIRGPYFSKPRQNKWFFGDSVFYFHAPWANPILSFDGCGRTVEALHLKGADILNSQLESVYNSGSDAPRGQWNRKVFYRNTWYFVGPWFVGEKASLDVRGLLISARERSELTNLNLFHPKAFESTIAAYFDHSYGYFRSGKKPHYRGPLNWKVLPLSSRIQAVVCDIHYIHNGGRNNPDLRRYVVFPVSPQQFAFIVFDFGGLDIYRDEVRTKPVLALTDSIINSMRLQVGPKTQAEWDKVKATCDDMSVTDTFGELAWPLFEEKKSRKKPEVDITPINTPKVIAQHK